MWASLRAPLMPHTLRTLLFGRELRAQRVDQRLALAPQLLTLRLQLVERALLVDEGCLRLEHALPQLGIHLLTQAAQRLGRRLDLGRERLEPPALRLDAVIRRELRLVQRGRVLELTLELTLARRRRRPREIPLPLELRRVHPVDALHLDGMLAAQRGDALIGRLTHMHDLLVRDALRGGDGVLLCLLTRLEAVLQQRLGVIHLVALTLLFERQQFGKLLLALRGERVGERLELLHLRRVQRTRAL